MALLQNLLSGGRQQEYQDFVGRYEQGAPWDGISDGEALDRYREVSRDLPPEDYEASAEEAFRRLTPEQRLQLGRHLRQGATQNRLDTSDLDGNGVDDRLQDPRVLAQMSSRMQQRQPGMLEQLLGGGMGGGGMGGGGMGGLAGGLGGLGGLAGSQSQAGGGMLGNPIAKAALAGIAAMAVQRMTRR